MILHLENIKRMQYLFGLEKIIEEYMIWQLVREKH
ncbi:hypothetical protein IMSAGC002_04494 [Lachnospiraceae bacterium]|nr:hypothetical protein IMSAGC002_04494 [Lachnospiraceae bacterium]